MRLSMLPSLRRLSRLALVGSVLGLASGSIVHAENLVTVSSTVDKDYAAKRASFSPPKEEKYVVIRGRFFGGRVYSSTLHHRTFNDIIRNLAVDLKRRAYVPAKGPGNADLVLLVHWGMTDSASRGYDSGDRDFQRLKEIPDEIRQNEEGANEAYESGDMNEATLLNLERQNLEFEQRAVSIQMAVNVARDQPLAASNAQLLGFTSSFVGGDKDPFGSQKNLELDGMAEEARFFVIVMAFDLHKERKPKEAPRPVWIARMSTRAAGINFNMALDRISAAGGTIYGESTQGVAFERVSKRKEKIEYGEMEVVEMFAK